MARSERFELPTLGIEIRCSIQLSYERVGGRLSDLAGEGQQPRCAPANGMRATLAGRLPCASEAGMPAAVLADIGGRALVAFVGRRAVVIGEGAGRRAWAVIVQIADVVGQAPMGMAV